MSTFMQELLGSAEKFQKDAINERFEKLSIKIKEMKAEVCHAIKEKYEDFNPIFYAAQDLDRRVSKLTAEIDDIAKQIKIEQIASQLKTASTEYQTITDQMTEMNLTLQVLKKLSNASNYLETCEEAIANKDFVKATQQVLELSAALTVQDFPFERDIKILQHLRSQSLDIEQKLKEELKAEFKALVTLSVLEQDPLLTYNLQIVMKSEMSMQLNEVLQAMEDMNILNSEIRNFADKFYERFVVPLVTCSVSIKKTFSDTCVILTLVAKKLAGKELEKLSTNPLTVFPMFFECLTFANEYLLSRKVTRSDKALFVMQIFSEYCFSRTLNLLMEKSVIPSVPNDYKELESFRNTIVKLEMWDVDMSGIQFMAENDQTITYFATNVNAVYSNKKYEAILTKARELMKQDIHNLVQVGGGELTSMPGIQEKEELVMGDKVVPVPPPVVNLQFPKCYVSCWTHELIDLAYETMKEAVGISPSCATQLVCCVENIFTVYIDVVPVYHKDTLATLPQLAAVHHNNCMYLAHHLLTIGHQYKHKLPGKCFGYTARFLDFVPQLRRLGVESFLTQVLHQRDQMLDCLKAAKDFSNISSTGRKAEIDRCFRQILHQFSHLQKIWQPVLPEEVYNRTAGALLNSVLHETITLVTSLEDIATDDAVQIHLILSNLVDKAPDLFQNQGTDPPESLLLRYTRCWLKLKQLKMVLNASLLEITEQWADGKGLLAKCFSSAEIKQLIRALFQNTDYRAAALAKIK